jgi:hypothetical protein
LGSAGWKDQPGIGRVVVGDDDHRPPSVGGPEFADDVVGRPFAQRLAQAALAGREVIGDSGRANRAQSGTEQTAAPQRGNPAKGTQSGADAERPPVGPVRRLRLDSRLGPELGEAFDDPLGGAALAFGGGGAVDLLELLQPLAQPGLVRAADPLLECRFGRQRMGH